MKSLRNLYFKCETHRPTYKPPAHTKCCDVPLLPTTRPPCPALGPAPSLSYPPGPFMAKITTTLPEAKARAKRAHRAARHGDTIRAAIYDRWLADTLSAAAGQNPVIAATMFHSARDHQRQRTSKIYGSPDGPH